MLLPSKGLPMRRSISGTCISKTRLFLDFLYSRTSGEVWGQRRGIGKVRMNLGIFKTGMTPEEICEAQRLAAEAWEDVQGTTWTLEVRRRESCVVHSGAQDLVSIVNAGDRGPASGDALHVHEQRLGAARRRIRRTLAGRGLASRICALRSNRGIPAVPEERLG